MTFLQSVSASACRSSFSNESCSVFMKRILFALYWYRLLDHARPSQLGLCSPGRGGGVFEARYRVSLSSRPLALTLTASLRTARRRNCMWLFNNAGVVYPSVRELTTDGYDRQFGTNVPSTYFTTLLLPALFEGAKDAADGEGTCGDDFINWPRVDYEALVDTPKRNLRTSLQRYTTGMEKRILFWLCHPPALGALTRLWAGTSPETVDFSGKYLIPWARVGQASKARYERWRKRETVELVG
ncbi:hypothetical protein DFH11DRAFT_1542876 [Phellopilus nigrolimitatus]|nr:hypothetical protein DFH11DRAFT_1542876 [Phellopilus nigrolimitatus]